MSKDAKYKSSEETTTNVTGQFSVYVKDHFTISDKRNKEKLHQITVTDFRASPPRGSIYLGLVCSSLVTVSFFLFPGSSQSLHYRHFELDNSLLWMVVLCIVGCFSASLICIY